MLRRYDIEQGAVVGTENESAKILVFTSPDAAERERLLKDHGLDEHTLTSALDPEEQARIEFEDDYIGVIYKRPQNYSSADQFVFKVSSVGAFLFRGKLVIVAPEDVAFFEGKPFQKVTSHADILLKILYRTIYHFYGHLKAINAISTEIEQKINLSMENRYLINMFTLEKSLVYYLDAINSNEVVIERLRNSVAKLGPAPELAELLDDIVVENRQCAKQAEIYSNILSSLMDARASIVSNNLNILIKKLTVLSVVFMPLNILAGIGGMSEFSMMTKGLMWPLSYGLFTVGLIGVAFLTYWILKKTGLDSNTTVRR